MVFGFELIGAGAILIGIFAYINFVLQPKWYPAELGGEVAAASGAPIPHAALGWLLAILFFAGVILVSAGSVEIGILRSRG